MQIEVVSGYGFYVYVSDEYMTKFIRLHEDVINKLERGRELTNFVNDSKDLRFLFEDIKEKFYDWTSINTPNQGLYGVIADVMSKETGIRWEYYVADEDSDDAIIFPRCFPWLYNDVEKTMTEEKLKEICNKYIAELGGQLIPEYIDLEYQV